MSLPSANDNSANDNSFEPQSFTQLLLNLQHISSSVILAENGYEQEKIICDVKFMFY